MQRKKLLYIMGIDWNWIYQRPQVLAEKLTRDFEVTTVFPRSILKAGNSTKDCTKVQKNETADSTKSDVALNGEPQLHHRILWTLPYQEKNNLLGAISRKLNAKIFKDIHSFDYIYIGYPQYARYIPKDYAGKIIYDCLDNFEELYPDQKRVYKVTEQEMPLIKRCDLLFVSSEYLRKRVNAKAGEPKSKLLRNAVKLSGEICEIKASRIRENYKLCYIGTISEWMDYDLLVKSVEKVSNIQYQMLGPVVKQVECPAIHYEGVVEHARLKEAIADYDCLIMPFQLNEIVLAVDPVKLYEYISFGKCIISVYYPEVEQFGDFVYFYRTEEEYVKLLEELKQKGFPPKYDAAQQKAFLQNNTWDKRYETLREEILKLK